MELITDSGEPCDLDEVPDEGGLAVGEAMDPAVVLKAFRESGIPASAWDLDLDEEFPGYSEGLRPILDEFDVRFARGSQFLICGGTWKRRTTVAKWLAVQIVRLPNRRYRNWWDAAKPERDHVNALPYSVRWTTPAQLREEMLRWDREDEGEDGYSAWCLLSDVAFVWELGADYPNAMTLQAVRQFLELRIAAALPTFVTLSGDLVSDGAYRAIEERLEGAVRLDLSKTRWARGQGA